MVSERGISGCAATKKKAKSDLILAFFIIMSSSTGYAQTMTDCINTKNVNEGTMERAITAHLPPGANNIWYEMGITAAGVGLRDGAIRCFMGYVWEADDKTFALEELLRLEKEQPDTVLGEVVREARLKLLAEIAARVESESVFSSNANK